MTWFAGWGRGVIGTIVSDTDEDGNAVRGILPKYQSVDPSGAAKPSGTSTDPISTQGGALPAGTDRSGTITTAGTAQVLAPANANRRGLTIQNTSDTAMFVSESGTPASATYGYLLDVSSAPFKVSTNRVIYIWCGAAGRSFAATEW